MNTAANSYPHRLSAPWDVARNFAAVFADPKTVFGIKLGLAGLLSVYLSQLLRLGHANWALFTVLVLAPAQYVGAIAQRSVARVVGTIIGGFVGVCLVGNYEQDRLFFLLFTFGYLWLCMYMYGGTLFPYSFFLCANTLITVSSSGIFDPIDAWSVGIARTLEILTGVVSIMVFSKCFAGGTQPKSVVRSNPGIHTELSLSRAQAGCHCRRFGEMSRSNPSPGAGALLG